MFGNELDEFEDFGSATKQEQEQASRAAQGAVGSAFRMFVPQNPKKPGGDATETQDPSETPGRSEMHDRGESVEEAKEDLLGEGGVEEEGPSFEHQAMEHLLSGMLRVGSFEGASHPFVDTLRAHEICDVVIVLSNIPGTENPADILTKPLAWHQMRVFVKPLLMWKGDAKEAKTSAPPGSNTNPEGSDAGSGLEQSRDSAETVTTSDRDSSGNAGSAGVMRANTLWNDQCAPLACEDD